jgi:hypothetical protein
MMFPQAHTVSTGDATMRIPSVPVVLQDFPQVAVCHLTIAQYLPHQARPYGFAPMDGHNCAPSIGMLQEMMAASHAGCFEAMTMQCSYDLAAGDPRESGHPSTQTR